MVESVDLYPTLCALAGLEVPAGLDGASFAKLLDDPTAPTKEAVLHLYPRGNRIGRALRTERYRLVEWKVPGAADDTAIYELYDYQSDPGENKNLAAEQPEVVKQLKEKLAAFPAAKPQVKAAAANDAKAPAKGKAGQKKRAKNAA
jgi:iduronate 2-sulfatase